MIALIFASVLGCAGNGECSGDCTDGGTSDGGVAVVLDVEAIAGTHGTLAWLTEATGASTDELVFQGQYGGSWEVMCTGVSRCVLEAGVEAVRVETLDGQHRSEEAVPTTHSMSGGLDREDGAFWVGDQIAFSIEEVGDRGPAELYLERRGSDGTTWWDGTLWLSAPAAYPEATQKGTPQLVEAAGSETARVDYSLVVGVAAEDWGGGDSTSSGGILALSRVDLPVIELGRRVLWGDPHVHSDLSLDGCEDHASGCQGPDSEPGADVFVNAAANGLDWTVLADHAEMTTYWGSPEAEPIDVWTRQQELAVEADGGVVIPFIGYEWTYARSSVDSDGYREGGHRTVILEEPEACPEWRIGATPNPSDQEKGWGTTVVSVANEISATSPELMRTAMEDAAETCGEMRALFIAHHPALSRPQPIDWRAANNEPDVRFEPLIEMVSEHGTSECFDITDPHCDFRLFDEDGYYQWGSFQAAISLGHKLGVMGGTDTHDARPASFGDGPSATSITLSDGRLAWQNYPGAMTGTMAATPFDRYAVIDAMFARATMASTRAFIEPRAFVETTDGRLLLPGAEVESDEPVAVTVSLTGSYDPNLYVRVGIDLLNEAGDTVAEIEATANDDDAILRTTISGDDCTACYVRVRLYEDDDDEGERIWLSPWFF